MNNTDTTPPITPKNTLTISGYKTSAIGIIPTDWLIDDFKQHVWFQEGPGLRNWQFKSEGIKIINITNIKDETIYLDRTERYISEDELNNKYEHFLIDANDIVMASSGASYCKVGIVKQEHLPLLMNTSVIRFKPKPSILYNYLWQFLNSFILKKQIDFLITGGAQPNFGPYHLNQVKLPIPTLPEQQKITEILSTWDEAIASCKKTINTIKARNTGLSQQLLTSTKRLSGFNDKWINTHLGKIVKRVTKKNEELNDTVVTISAQRGFVLQEDFFKKRVASDTLSGYYLLKKGQFAYNKSYSNGYPMGAFKRLNDFEKAVVTTLYICFELREKVCPDYMVYFFENGLMTNNLMKVAKEGGRAHGLLNIGLDDFMNLELTIPSFEEQKAISQVLETANQELKSYETKLEALQLQKKGLMQQLLTGKLRVNVN